MIGVRSGIMDEKVKVNGSVPSLYGFEFRDVDNRRTGREKTYDIKQFWQRSHEIIGMAIQGMKYVEIAKILNISPATVSNTLNSTLGREKLSGMRKDRDEGFIELQDHIELLAHKSLDIYEEFLDSDRTDPRLKKEVADTVILDVAGMRAPAKTESKSLHAYATVEEIEEFKRRGIEAARESGKLIVVPGEGKKDNEELDN